MSSECLRLRGIASRGHERTAMDGRAGLLGRHCFAMDGNVELIDE